MLIRIVFSLFISLLLDENFETSREREPRLDHGRKLAGDIRNILFTDTTQEAETAWSGDLLLRLPPVVSVLYKLIKVCRHFNFFDSSLLIFLGETADLRCMVRLGLEKLIFTSIKLFNLSVCWSSLSRMDVLFFL